MRKLALIVTSHTENSIDFSFKILKGDFFEDVTLCYDHKSINDFMDFYWDDFDELFESILKYYRHVKCFNVTFQGDTMAIWPGHSNFSRQKYILLKSILLNLTPPLFECIVKMSIVL